MLTSMDEDMLHLEFSNFDVFDSNLEMDGTESLWNIRFTKHILYPHMFP